MKTPDMIASSLVDGPNPDDRTLPLIVAERIVRGDGVCEGAYRDVLTVSRKAYKGLIAAAVREALAERDAEVARLKRGEFTAAEVHDICHNLRGTVPAAEFAAGCAAEQRKLYGCAPDADEVARLRNQVAGYEHVQHLWNKGMASTCDAQNALKQRCRELEAEVSRLRRENDQLSDTGHFRIGLREP